MAPSLVSLKGDTLEGLTKRMSVGMKTYEEYESHQKTLCEHHDVHMDQLQDEIHKSVTEHTQTVVQAFLARMSQQHTAHVLKTTKTTFMSQVELEHFQSHYREAYEELEKTYHNLQGSLKTELDAVKVSLQETVESCRVEVDGLNSVIGTLKGCTVTGDDWKREVDSKLGPFLVSWEEQLTLVYDAHLNKLEEWVKAVQQDDVVLEHKSEIDELKSGKSQLSSKIMSLEQRNTSLYQELHARQMDMEAKTSELDTSRETTNTMSLRLSALKADIEAEKKTTADRQREYAERERQLHEKVHELESQEISLKASIQSLKIQVDTSQHEVNTSKSKCAELTLHAEDIQTKLDLATEHLEAFQRKHEEELDELRKTHANSVTQIQISHSAEREQSVKNCEALRKAFIDEHTQLVVKVKEVCGGLPVPHCTTVVLTEENKDLDARWRSKHTQLEAELVRLRSEADISEKGLHAMQSKFEAGHQEMHEYFKRLQVLRKEMHEMELENTKLSARNQKLEAWYQSQHTSWTRFHADDAPPFRCEGHVASTFHFEGIRSISKTVRRHSNCLCHPVLEPGEEPEQQPPLQKTISVDKEVLDALPDAPPEMQDVVQKLPNLPTKKKIELLEFMQSDAAKWFPRPQCSGVWVEHTSTPQECQSEGCTRMVKDFNDGALCSNGGHRICWKPCLFSSVEWDKMKSEDVQRVLDIVNS